MDFCDIFFPTHLIIKRFQFAYLWPFHPFPLPDNYFSEVVISVYPHKMCMRVWTIIWPKRWYTVTAKEIGPIFFFQGSFPILNVVMKKEKCLLRARYRAVPQCRQVHCPQRDIFWGVHMKYNIWCLTGSLCEMKDLNLYSLGWKLAPKSQKSLPLMFWGFFSKLLNCAGRWK